MSIRTEVHDFLAIAREAFLSGAPVPEGLLRDEILKSWRRSALVGAAPEVPTLPFCEDFEHGLLSRAAVPVLERFADQLEATVTTLLLADSQSRIIRRWTGDRSLAKALDRSEALPGFSLAEQYCGTNGIGSVAEERRAVYVAGSEHWADRFTSFACVGAPVIHPATHQLQGVVTLCCRVKDSNELMLPTVTTIAAVIEDRLLHDSSRREQALLERFLAAGRSSRRPIVVLNDRVIMTNASAAGLLDRADHAVLWQQATEVLAARRARSTDLVLVSGETVGSRIVPVEEDGRVIGALIELLDRRSPMPCPPTTANGAPPPLGARSQGGLIGRSRQWMTVLDLACHHRTSTCPLLVLGEPGVGKLAVSLSILVDPAAGPITVFDGALQPASGSRTWLAELRARLDEPAGTVIIKHIDLVEPGAARALSVLVDEAAAHGAPRIVATATNFAPAGSAGDAWLPPRFNAGRLEIPPLRERREDITELATAFLGRHGEGSRWSSGALQALVRWDWPGNVRQLEAVVKGAIAIKPDGELSVEHLAPELRSAPRHDLGKLEKMELDAIVAALERCHGNKSDAAALLGISRSTIYRKIKAFRLDLERTVL